MLACIAQIDFPCAKDVYERCQTVYPRNRGSTPLASTSLSHSVLHQLHALTHNFPLNTREKVRIVKDVRQSVNALVTNVR